MRRLIMTTATIALTVGISACASKPKTAPEAPIEIAQEAPARVDTGAVTNSGIEAPRRVVDAGPAAGSLADFQVNVGDRVYFDLDQYRLGNDAQNILKRQAAWLSSYPAVNIIVAGNCDERGTREYNLALGERRASIVKDYLVSLGVDPARIQTVSYGKERPLAMGSDDAAWAQNRNGFTQITSGVVG